MKREEEDEENSKESQQHHHQIELAYFNVRLHKTILKVKWMEEYRTYVIKTLIQRSCAFPRLISRCYILGQFHALGDLSITKGFKLMA